MRRDEIEDRTREFQKTIWQDRKILFPLGVPPPKAVFEPRIAAKVLGLEYEPRATLGTWGEGNRKFEIAGLMDRPRKLIAVSYRFEDAVMRFTGAHEVGHFVLQHKGHILHRDRPVFDLHVAGRDTIERDADYFAACFLASRGLVEEQMQIRFRTKLPLPLTDAVAFNLCGQSQHRIMGAGPGSFEFAAAVASAKQFNGSRFPSSLMDYFGISVSAMAYRLMELRLIES